MKRKVVAIFIILALILSINALKVNAATDVCKILLVPNSETVAPGDVIDIEIKMSNITDANGLAAYGATVTLDSNAFTYSKIKGTGEWETPIYNEGNIVATVTSGEGQTEDQAIAILTLKVKSDVQDGEYEVKLDDITVSNGIETFSISPVTVKLNVENNTSSGDENNSVGNSTGNSTGNNDNKNDSNASTTTESTKNEGTTQNTNKNQSTATNSSYSKNLNNASSTSSTSATSIPKTGVSDIIIPVIAIIAIVGGVSYFNYRKLKNV